MGIFLSSPSTLVELEAGVGSSVNYGVGSMQGWRKNMEDAHIALCDIASDGHPTDMSIFGVFDGHGGKEVAIFSQFNFVKELLNEERFGNKDYGNALRNCFHQIDTLLETGNHDALLTLWRNWPNPSDRQDYLEFKKSQYSKPEHVTATNVLHYSVDLHEDSHGRSHMTKSHVTKKASKKDVQDMLLAFLAKQAKTAPTKTEAATNTTPAKKKGKKSKKHSKKKHRKAKKSSASQEHEAENDEESAGSRETEDDDEEEDEETDSPSVTEIATEVSALRIGDDDNSPITVETSVQTIAITTDASAGIDSVPSSSGSAGTSPEGEIVEVSETIQAELTYKIVDGRKSCLLPPHRLQAGCTAVVALLVNDEIIVANAGDSRAVLCREDGTAYELSFDHKPQNATELERIETAGGFVSEVGRINGNLNLSRSLGDLKYKQCKSIPRHRQMITAEPDITVTKILPQDRFMILACDGVWDCFSSQGAIDFVNEKLALDMKPTEIVTEIFRQSLAASTATANGVGTDNMTCIIVMLNQKLSVSN